MEAVQITVKPNGPYIVKGAVELIGSDGAQLPADKVVALCRCGGSANKPFCDGTHSKIGFAAAEAARDEFDRSRSAAGQASEES